MATKTPTMQVPHETATTIRTRKGQMRWLTERSILHFLLVLLSLSYLIPFAWLVSTSLKPNDQIFTWPPIWVPSPATFEHYQRDMFIIPFWTFLRNTVILALLNVVGTVISCSLVAYGVSRINWVGRNALFAILLGTIMIPGQVTIVPLFITFKNLGWLNTYMPLVVPAFLGNAFSIFLLRQFFMTIPQELSDAARMDGASEWGIYSKVILPLAKPALATVGLFTFMGVWNDFLGPLIYLKDQDLYTMAIGLAMFKGQYGNEWGGLMAASTVMTLPLIVLFFFTQRTFIQGITLTGIKG